LGDHALDEKPHCYNPYDVINFEEKDWVGKNSHKDFRSPDSQNKDYCCDRSLDE
jgi:hypothetical protein